MLSLQQAIEIKESIVSYLKATFTFRKKEVAEAFSEFIHHPANGMFKGPYISLKLGFVRAKEEEITRIPLDIKPGWIPYDHQVKAWHRLSAHDRKPQPTIVTTGTGSGKTEAFLYPVLDYCYRQKHRQGIKAIILYPMNALATDQAKRLGEIISGDERLKGQIRAGLFIGEGRGGEHISRNKMMGPDHIIEDRNTIVDSPPDILLTNFKMLDYALMKHNYHSLWMHNMPDRELLQFLVLDELHTYDGAQGTDVANLIRRLKLKLHMEEGQLCPAGTSATLGSGPEARTLLADYAQKLFGETISEESVITENRIAVEDFFDEDDTLLQFIPLPNKLKDLVYHERDSFESYIQGHVDAWQQESGKLARGLRQLKIVKDLLTLFSRGKDMLTRDEIMRELSLINDGFRTLPDWDAEHQYSPRERGLESLLTLIARARDEENSSIPFIYQQVQLWVRELSGVQYTLEDHPQFTFRDQIDARSELSALPPWYCRECSSSGWLGVRRDGAERFSKNIAEIYQMFVSNTQSEVINKNLYYLLPKDELSLIDFRITGYEPTNFEKIKIDPVSLEVVADGKEGLEIQAVRKLSGEKAILTCPCCNSDDTTALVGTRIPTLSSIAVSQTLATDLDPADDRNRKVLAFTNSVQDAAHQAGFVESRNFRFTLRASIQKVINRQYEPIRLSDLSNEFIDYWKEHADTTGDDHLSGYFYRFFPKDYLGKITPADYQIGSGEYREYFIREFDLRVQHEIYSEFGFLSRIGRTLEKTGASSVCFDEEALNNSWDNISDWIRTNDLSGTINRESFLRFTNLILHRSRNRGAIDHPYLSKFREERLSIWDLNWQKDGRHFLNPKYHAKRGRLPKLLSNKPSIGGLLDSTFTQRGNWFHSYFIKSFPLARVTTDFINEFYDIWLEALSAAGLLLPANHGELTNYAIAPEKIWVKKDVKIFCCSKCEDIVYTQDENRLVDDALCLSYRCTGTYHHEEPLAPNYYKAVYNRNRFPRVYAAEHTGLLVREKREELETDFKERKRFNSVNTLVATSTLEMGIDIGDLNTAYNNSTPPLPANFLQRIGRAGRKSGSSVIVNFSKNQNHDLYYFTDPREMMEGEVNTPGCYLEAKDILRRHFTAYCFDSWASNDPQENVIPNRIGELKLEKTKITDSQLFINRFNAFVQNNTDELVDRFLLQYTPLVHKKAFPAIADDLKSGIFYNHILNVFSTIQGELKHLEKRIAELQKERDERRLSQNDPLYEEYRKEIRSLSGIKRAINKRSVTEHMTNMGILPNYAFPETGVTLHGTVWQPSGDDSGGESGDYNEVLEIVRPASQAIKELAPENFFYTQGYRLPVSGLNTFDWHEEQNSHRKRFCSKCDHIDLEVHAKTSTCPKCGDASWGSASNVHHFVKLTSVRSFTATSQARLDDRNDDRDSQLYQVMHHVSYNPGLTKGAWILKEIPFGIEFVPNATISWVNYGRRDSLDARRVRVNGSDVMAKGFVTCRYCGKSASATHLLSNAEEFHYAYCKKKDHKYNGETDEVFSEVYLFREMQTEIMKIILPVQEFNTEADIRMFQAGLELGLTRYFKGNPGHIHTINYKEYNGKTGRFDRFLLLYDSIPGGSGYLEELFDNKNFTLLLKNSYESIRDCSCQLMGHDGCYRCIYSYGNQYYREGLSRERAEKWFERIYSRTDSWEFTPQGLTHVTNTGQIEESELEMRFVKLLSAWCQSNNGFAFNEILLDGIKNYDITIEQGDLQALYRIRPQTVLGPKDGIEYNTRTDFLIVCRKYIYKGEKIIGPIPHIALYLDGYQYHASAEHNVFENDVKIRKAIAAHRGYRVWTLTWEDLDYFELEMNKEARKSNKHHDPIHRYFASNFLSNYNRLIQVLTGEKERINFAAGASDMQRLIDLMIYPAIRPWLRSRFVYLGSWTHKPLAPSFNPAHLSKLINEEISEGNYIEEEKVKDFNALIAAQYKEDFGFARLRSWVNISEEKLYGHLQIKDTSVIDKPEWQRFWSLFNIFQTDELPDEETQTAGPGKSREELLSELLSYYEELYHPLLKQCVELGLINESNMDHIDSLQDGKGEIIADGDLVIEQLKLVVNPYSDESRAAFEKLNYSVFMPDEIGSIDLNRLMNQSNKLR